MNDFDDRAFIRQLLGNCKKNLGIATDIDHRVSLTMRRVQHHCLRLLGEMKNVLHSSIIQCTCLQWMMRASMNCGMFNTNVNWLQAVLYVQDQTIARCENEREKIPNWLCESQTILEQMSNSQMGIFDPNFFRDVTSVMPAYIILHVTVFALVHEMADSIVDANWIFGFLRFLNQCSL